MAEVLSQNQIDALLNAALSGEMDLKAEEASPEKKYRKYDFYSPRKFTKDRIKMLNGVFDSYSRSLNSRINGLLHTNCDVEVESIEEQRYYEFSNALTEGDVLTLSHLKYKGKQEEVPVLFHITRSLMLSMVDRMIGGEGDPDEGLPADYSFTDLELKLYERIMRDFISVLGNSWENYITLNFEFGRVEVNPTLVQPLSLDETIVIIDTILKFSNCEGRLSICLPGMMLTNLFAEISRENPGIRNSTEDNSDVIFDSLRVSDLDVVAELCTAQLKLEDIFHLNVGDVIELNRVKDSPVYLNIGNRRWFDGKMGISGKNIAVKINETYYKPPERDVDQDAE